MAVALRFFMIVSRVVANLVKNTFDFNNKNLQVMRNYLLITFLTLPFYLFSQSKFTIEVKEAGTLLSLLGNNTDKISTLIVTGKINKEDFLVMRRMINRGILIDINLENTTIESGPLHEENNIPRESFINCNQLESIILPKNTNVILFSAFEGCSNLKNIKIPATLSFIDSHSFRFCTSLTEFKFPDNHILLNSGSFLGCTALKELEFPDGVLIFRDAFSGCILDKVILPSNYDLGAKAFSQCYIKEIYCKGEPSNITEDTFEEGIKKNTVVYIPKGTLNKYTSWSTPCWPEFKTLKEYETSTSNQNISTYSCKIIPEHKSLKIITNKTDNISIYTMSGNLVLCEKLSLGTKSIPLKSGIYVVKTDDACKKIIIK